LLSGESSTWDLSNGDPINLLFGSLTVGKDGAGSLTITSNASLRLGILTVAENSPDASVAVSNNAKLFIAGAVTTIGQFPDSVGTMNVTTGGEVSMKALVLGDLASSSGSLTVTGTGSTDTTTGVDLTSLRVGYTGHGELVVRNGAYLIDTGNTFRIDGSNSSVTIDGRGSSVYADQALLLVEPGHPSAITISGEGLLRTAGGLIDNGSRVKVLDANSRWEINDRGLTLGSSFGNGLLLIDAGAVTVNSAVTLGGSAFGQVLLENNGSLTVTGGNSIIIGDGAPGTLNMYAGTQVSAAGAVIGKASQLNLFGAGAQFTVNGLSVGRGVGEAGTLSIENGHLSANLLLVNKGSTVTVTGGSIDLGGFGLGQADPGQIVVRPGGRLKDDGAVTATVINVLNTGSVGGSGTINGKLINGGKVSPDDPQTLTVNGDYQQLNGGLLQIAIAGKTMPEFDHLNATGHITLDMGSKLELDFINGFAPKMGDKFDFLQSGDAVITDNFSEVVITGLEPGFQFVLAPDGVGSFGLVALNDGVPTTVPEPSTYAMLILGGALLATRFRRR
jgi:T5SS/PEP-CTERM-associated repeat protein